MSIEDRLAAVEQARNEYRITAITIDQELQREKERRLRLLADKLDLATREAFDAGAKKAWLMRAWGTKAAVTVNDSLNRTENLTTVAADEAPAPDSGEFSWNEDERTVKVSSGGEEAIFTFEEWDDGAVMLWSDTDLYSGENMEVCNSLVVQFDGNDLVKTRTPLGKRLLAFLSDKL